jgi:GWxTD domain-containing protein
VKNFWLLAVVAAGMAAPALAQAVEDEGGLRLGTVRFYRGDGTTRIKGLLEVPHRLLGVSDDGKLRFWVGIKVQDSTGLTIMDRGWAQAVRAVPGVQSAASLEMLDFAVAPGRYTLSVRVHDSLTGSNFEASREVVGFGSTPMTSDLMLTPALRVADPTDTVPRGGEWRHGSLVLVATPFVRVAPAAPQLYYMLEAYSAKRDTATISVEVLTEAGASLTRTKPRLLEVDSGGSILSGGLNLGGVPQGTYRLRVYATLGGRDTTEEAGFAVRQPEIAQGVAIARSDDDYFANLTEKQLDSMAAPLMYIAETGEMAVYKSDLSPQAKVRFLVGFWAKRDPTPGQPGNVARDEYYERIGFIDRAFRDPGRGTTPGWRTDRGRIYLKYGPPDDKWERPQEGNTPPLEVWRYTKTRNRYFIFADRGRIGLFSLAHSDEVKEPGRPDWQEMIGWYGLQAVERYLGVDLGLRGGEPR